MAKKTLGNNIDDLLLDHPDDDIKSESKKPKRIRIILEEGDNIPPGGQFFGINGRQYLLKPGVEVDVPAEIVDVLNNAIESIPTVDDSRNIIGMRNRLRFPFRVIREL